MKKKLKNVDILDILVTVGLCMVVLALFELLMNNWLSALYVGSIGILLCAAHYYSLPSLPTRKKVAAKPTAVVTPKKVTKRRKAWKFPKIPMPPKWVFVSAGRILGLLVVILIFALIGKGIWWALTGTGTHAVVAVVPPPPIAAIATNTVASASPVAPTASAAPGGKAAVASNGGLVMVDSSITINNSTTTTTTTQAAPSPQPVVTKEQTVVNDQVMPNWVPMVQFPPPPEIIGATSEIEVNMGPGEYRNYILPVLCRPEVFPVYNATVLRPFVNGHLYVLNPYDADHSYVIRTYGLHNPQQQRSCVRIRLTRIGM
jgi:hypothetical protein